MHYKTVHVYALRLIENSSCWPVVLNVNVNNEGSMHHRIICNRIWQVSVCLNIICE